MRVVAAGGHRFLASPRSLVRLGPDPGPGLRLVDGVVFHTARCGTTLLCRLLEAIPGVAVLIEPDPINAVLNCSGLDAGQRRPLLRSVIAGLTGPLGTGRTVVLKTSSWNVLRGEELRIALGGPPYLYLSRDLLEVAVSLIERPPPWFEACPGAAGASAEERAAAAVTDFRRAARHLGHCVHFDHSQLPGAVTDVARLFGLPRGPTAEQIHRIAASHVRDTTRPWRPDGEEKRTRASPALRNAIARNNDD
jgi:hypothetical protein